MKNIIINTLFFTFALTSISVHSIEIGDQVDLHGFASQGFVYSPDNTYYGEGSGNGSFKFREVGVNLAWQATQQLRVSGQIYSRTADEAANGKPRLDFLLADYRLLDSPDEFFGVRLGRVKLPLGFYNETRDIPLARPGVTVPGSVYFDSFRDVVISYDGAGLYGGFVTGLGDFTWTLFKGISKIENQSVETYIYEQNIQGSFEQVNLLGLNIMLVPQGLRNLQLGVSFLSVDMELEGAQSAVDAGTAAAMAAKSNDPNLVGAEISQNFGSYVTGTRLKSLYALASVQYSSLNWIWTAEYLQIHNDVNIEVVGNARKEKPVSEGYYLQLEWVGHPVLQSFVRYDALYLEQDDRKGNNLPQYPNNKERSYSEGVTFGGRWYIQPSLALSAEVAAVKGTAYLPRYDGVDNVMRVKNWNVFLATLSYQF